MDEGDLLEFGPGSVWDEMSPWEQGQLMEISEQLAARYSVSLEEAQEVVARASRTIRQENLDAGGHL